MKELLKNKIAVVAGTPEHITRDIVRTLLLQGAMVIVPAKSAQEIKDLNENIKGVKKDKLVSFITDYPDYYNAFETAKAMIRKFGKIDLGIVYFESPSQPSELAETGIIDWEKMIDQNITSYFIIGRIMLDCIKQNKQSMFVSVCREPDPINVPHSNLGQLSIRMQKEMAGTFSELFKKRYIRFHHISLRNSENKILTKKIIRKTKQPDSHPISSYLLEMYMKRTNHNTDLFHVLSPD